MNARRPSGAALLALLLALAACASGPRPDPYGHAERACVPPPSAAPPGAGAATDPAVLAALQARGFSPRALAAAQSIGVTEPLLRLTEPGAERRNPLAHLRERQRFSDDMLLAFLTVEATAAQIECERERGRTLRVALQGQIDQRARQVGLLGVGVGAVAAVASGALSLAAADTASNVIAIGAGTIGAGLAAYPFLSAAEGELRTRDNLLVEVWEGQRAPPRLPPGIWSHLNRAVEPEPSPRDLLVAVWSRPELLGPRGSEDELVRAPLILGEGGSFSVETLDARDAMLSQLGAAVALKARYLRALLAETAARR
jgi:hypothetical protein